MAFLRSTSGRVGMKQDGCLARPRLATIPDALPVFCHEQVSVDNRNAHVSSCLYKLNVIVSGRRCHDIHQNKNPLNGGPTQEIESDIETRQEKKEKKEWNYCSQEGTYRMKRKQIPSKNCSKKDRASCPRASCPRPPDVYDKMDGNDGFRNLRIGTQRRISGIGTSCIKTNWKSTLADPRGVMCRRCLRV